MKKKIYEVELKQFGNIVLDEDVGYKRRISDEKTYQEMVEILKENDLILQDETPFYVWQDKKGNKYRLQDLEKDHLFNIIRYIERGNGRVHFSTLELLVEKAKKLGFPDIKTAKHYYDSYIKNSAEAERKNTSNIYKKILEEELEEFDFFDRNEQSF